MRVTTIFRRLLGIVQLFVTDIHFGEDGLTLGVRPRWRRPRCGQCHRVASGYDRLPRRRWRHLGLGRTLIWLAYAPRRVQCPSCGVRTEATPWARADSRFTRDFEEMAAYLAQCTDFTAAAKQLGCAWRSISGIVERVVRERLEPGRLEGLERIGIDEFSYRKRQRYLTVVVDHDRKRVVWAAPGRSAQALVGFFDELRSEGRARIKLATIDMAGGYIKAVGEHLPNATIIFDRFHVQRLVSDAVDAVRREQLRELRGTPEGKALFHSRFSLLRNPESQSETDRQRLVRIARHNDKLYRAYRLKVDFAAIFALRQTKRAEAALRKWLAWASRSKLKPFVRVAKTIRKYFRGILAYFRTRLTNGVVEGKNNRLRVISRRAYGHHSPEALISLLYLCCGGIQIDPPLPTPT